MASGKDSPLNPAVAIALVVVVVVLIAAGGFYYMNRPASDPLADQVNRERKASGQSNADSALMGRQPPRAGASDYAPAGTKPPRPGG